MTNQGCVLTTLNDALLEHVLECTQASAITGAEVVQTLWSGFGQIVRMHLEYPEHLPRSLLTSVIVKHVQPPDTVHHPRGWSNEIATQRKLESYRVETHWYQQYAASCNSLCSVPKLLGSRASDHHTWLILEDLDVHFPDRYGSLGVEACAPCLQWLARFHALHFQNPGDGLWPKGTYWHLQTRQGEYQAMAEGPLKLAAASFDEALNHCRFQTLVHGDAKVANFCFSIVSDNNVADAEVAMVDFQYVGRGCGMRDVVYFLGSCLSDKDCQKHADALLDAYFDELRLHLPAPARSPVESAWRGLYAIAWADFNRFLAGWMPDHRKINPYMHAMTKQALAQLS